MPSPKNAPKPPNLAQISPKMSLKTLLFSAFLLSFIIIAANFTVQFQILSTPLTFGALTYPFSFLLLDILCEKFSPNVCILKNADTIAQILARKAVHRHSPK